MNGTQIWLVLIGFVVVCIAIFIKKAKLVEPVPTFSKQSRIFLFVAICTPFIVWIIKWLLDKFE